MQSMSWKAQYYALGPAQHCLLLLSFECIISPMQAPSRAAVSRFQASRTWGTGCAAGQLNQVYQVSGCGMQAPAGQHELEGMDALLDS